MGYIKDFEARLRSVLDGVVPEAVVTVVLTIAKKAVIESYKNGIEHGRLTAGDDDAPARGRKPTRGAKR